MAGLEEARTWEAKAAWAQAKRDESLAKVQPPLQNLPEQLPLNVRGLPQTVLSSKELEITEKYSAIQLLAKLQSRELSAEEVTRAFLRRAALAQLATNCVTELLWDDAIARAKHLDSLPEPLGPLHGLPISTKEHHGTKQANGTTNASFVAWVGQPHGSNMLYDILWDAGCVFFARTTQPQTIMHLETCSNVYGRTVNPYNRDLTPGGSSGGESALVGMRGSLMGVGGDIGGSVRCPAAHCGIYGFKPTCKRLPGAGQRVAMAGRESILSSLGPMTTDRDSLELFMKVALEKKPWRLDPGLTAKVWTPYKFTKPLKIAVQWWDGVVMPHPPMTRALREVSEACKAAGMEVVNWNCESLNHSEGWGITAALYWPDGGKEVVGIMEEAGEPLLPLTKFIIQEQPTVKDRNYAEYLEICRQRDAYRARYAQAWADTGKDDGREIDVILCPPSYGAATPHEQSRYWGYTSNWNLVDYPGVVFPVTTVDPIKDVKDTNHAPANKEDQFVYDMYSPEKYKDAPISLQIVGRRYYDEKVLAALVEVERAMGRS